MHISIRKPSAGWKVRGGDAESKALLRARSYGFGSLICSTFMQMPFNSARGEYVTILHLRSSNRQLFSARARAQQSTFKVMDFVCVAICVHGRNAYYDFVFFSFFFKSKTMCGGVRVISMIDLEWRAIMRLLTIVVC